MGWDAIASGSIAARATAAIDAITSALAELPPSDDPRMRASLVAGDLGASVLFGYRHRVTADRGFDDLAAARVEHAMDAADLDRPWITSGYAGLAFAMEHLGFNVEEDASGDADASLLALLRAPPPQLGHDWFRGAAGFAVHAIERLPRAGREIVAEVVALLDRRAERTDAGACWVTPAAHVPGGTIRFPDGARSLDPAHGHAGPVVALAAACAHGIAADVARPLLDRAVDWLWTQRLASSELAWFPTFAGQPTPARAGWCRGDVGIAGALHAAARAVDAPWQNRVLELARLAARRPPEDAGIDDAAICHGAAGLVQVFNRLYQATGEAVFRDAALDWLARLLDMRAPGTGVGGFVFPDIDDHRGPRRADPSLLFGAAGVALVLLAATTSIAPDWDRLFLMSVREPG